MILCVHFFVCQTVFEKISFLWFFGLELFLVVKKCEKAFCEILDYFLLGKKFVKKCFFVVNHYWFLWRKKFLTGRSTSRKYMVQFTQEQHPGCHRMHSNEVGKQWFLTPSGRKFCFFQSSIYWKIPLYSKGVKIKN